VCVQLQPLNTTGIEPDRAVLRITKESEIRQGSMLGAGAFGTVYRVCFTLFYCPTDYKSLIGAVS